jgi:hypothetical protein
MKNILIKQTNASPQKQIEKFNTYFNQLCQNVHEGFLDALPTYGTFDTIEKACKSFKENIKKVSLNEFDKSKDGNQNFIKKGIWEFSEMNVTSYDYSNDEIWNDLENRIKELKALQKERETLLKATKESEKDICIDVSFEGVEFERKPPIKKVTKTIAVKTCKV